MGGDVSKLVVASGTIHIGEVVLLYSACIRIRSTASFLINHDPPFYNLRFLSSMLKIERSF